ncbi:MAG: hypothetical protein KDA46_07485 [Parvularculaceae bacterium]|nr:hypothetical protein [Parvularculaceae bacterium]
MKIEVEFRSDMSRADLFKALRVTLEATGRLAHRMTPAELQKIKSFGAAIAATAEHERARRGPRRLEFAGRDADGDRGGRAGVSAQ